MRFTSQRLASPGVSIKRRGSLVLLPNADHVHLILVPADETGLSRAVGETYRR